MLLTLRRPLLLLGFSVNLKRQLGIHIPAIFAGTMWQLGVAALRTADIVNGLKRLVRSALALARLTDALNRKHDKPLKEKDGSIHNGSNYSPKKGAAGKPAALLGQVRYEPGAILSS